jgi:hypothetical protein
LKEKKRKREPKLFIYLGAKNGIFAKNGNEQNLTQDEEFHFEKSIAFAKKVQKWKSYFSQEIIFTS